MIRITAVGDIMPGGLLHGTDKEYLSNEVKKLLNKADVRVGTLECAIGDTFPFFEEKMRRKADVIHAKDDDVERLLEMNINVVSLANNHFFDLGYEGAWHTMNLLNDKGILYCGAGRNIEDASRPAVVELKGKTIAFIGFCDYREDTVGWCPIATDSSPGINPLYDEHVVKEISKCKQLYDYVVVISHWGLEHTVWPTRDVYNLVNKMISAGANLILGGHPHHVQPVINYSSSSVALSMGNFLFPDRIIVSPRSTFYPKNNVDIHSLPVTYGYPYVKEMTYKKWTDEARVGMVLIAQIDDKRTLSSYSLVMMDQENRLTSYNKLSKKNSISFKIILLLFKTQTYYFFDYLHRKINILRRYLR